MPSAIAMSTTHSSATRHAGFFGFGGLTLRPSLAGASGGGAPRGPAPRRARGSRWCRRCSRRPAVLRRTGAGHVRAPRPFILSCRRTVLGSLGSGGPVPVRWYRASTRRAAPATAARRFGRCEHGRPGTERQDEALEEGRAAHCEDDVGFPPRRALPRLDGDALRDPRRLPVEPQRDARVVRGRAIDEVGITLGPAPSPEGSTDRPVGRTPRTRSMRNSRSPVARWHQAARYHAPSAWKTRDRIDDSRRHLVARRRVVVDLDLTARLDGVAELLEVVGARDVDRERSRRPERVSSLARPVASGPSGSEPGTPSSARPAASSATPSAGVRRSGRSKYSASRTLTAPSSATRRSMSRSAVYGGSPHIGSSSRSSSSSARSTSKRAASSSSVTPGCASDPGHEREHALEPGAGGPGLADACSAPTRAAPACAGDHGLEPGHEVVAQRRRGEHLRVLEQPEHPGAERLAVHDLELDDDRAVLVAAPPPRRHRAVDDQGRPARRDADRCRVRRPLAVAQRVVADVRGRVGARRRLEGARLPRDRRRPRSGRRGTRGARLGRRRARRRTSARTGARSRTARGAATRPDSRTSAAVAGRRRRSTPRGRARRRAARAACALAPSSTTELAEPRPARRRLRAGPR